MLQLHQPAAGRSPGSVVDETNVLGRMRCARHLCCKPSPEVHSEYTKNGKFTNQKIGVYPTKNCVCQQKIGVYPTKRGMFNVRKMELQQKTAASSPRNPKMRVQRLGYSQSWRFFRSGLVSEMEIHHFS